MIAPHLLKYYQTVVATTAKYHWKCRDCGKLFPAGITGELNQPDSGWYSHETYTGHSVEHVNEEFPWHKERMES